MINKNDNLEGMRGGVIMVCSIVKSWKYPQVTKENYTMLPWVQCNIHFRPSASIWYCGYNYAIIHRAKQPASLPSFRNCTGELVAVIAFELLLEYNKLP